MKKNAEFQRTTFFDRNRRREREKERERERIKKSMVKDRTREFFSTCEALQRIQKSRQQKDSSVKVRLKKKNDDDEKTNFEFQFQKQTPLVPPKPPTSEFSKKASMISKQIHTTSMKLQTLSQQLRRSKGLFGGSVENINKLTFSIKSDITFLNRQLELLELSSDSGSSRGGPQTKEHHSAVVGQLQKGLLSTTKGFQGMLASRSETMKAQSDRRVKFGQHRPANSLGRPLNFRRHEERAFMSSKGNTTETDEAVQNLTQTRLMVREQNYLQARASAVADLEEHITDLGHIFVRLNDMVLEQEKDIERIDDNLGIAEENASKAHSELLKYLASVQGNRMLIAKVFGILMIFSVFFISFMA